MPRFRFNVAIIDIATKNTNKLQHFWKDNSHAIKVISEYE